MMDEQTNHNKAQAISDTETSPLDATPASGPPPDGETVDEAVSQHETIGPEAPEAPEGTMAASTLDDQADTMGGPVAAAETLAPPAWVGQLDGLAGQQERLADMFDDKLRYDASREEIIDKLHKEIQDYRNDMLGKIILPVLRDLISLDNEVIKFVKDRGDLTRFPPEKQDWNELLRQVAMFHDDIVEILDRYGVIAFEEESEAFNPRTQRSLDTRPTEHQDRNRTIAERIRPGFRWGDQVIRNEEVIVYTYKAPQEEPPVSEG